MPAIPLIALGVAAVGTGASIYMGAKANQAQNAALHFQQQQADLQAAIQQRQAIRSSRTAYANSQQEAENQGAGDTSASQGGLGSISSQLNSNLSFLDQYNTLSNKAGKALGEANTDKMWGSTFGEIGRLGEEAYANPAGVNGLVSTVGKIYH